MQWLYEGWNELDWPNLIGSVILGGIGWVLTRKVFLPIWVKSHERSKLYFSRREKDGVLRDLRLLRKFKDREHDIYLWCINKLIAVVLGSATMIGFMSLMMWMTILGRFRDLGVPIPVDIWDAPIPKTLERILSYTMAFMLGIATAIVMKHASDVRRIARYYTNMEEFKSQAKKILDPEDLKLLD